MRNIRNTKVITKILMLILACAISIITNCMSFKISNLLIKNALLISTESIGLIGIDPYEYVYLEKDNRVYLPLFIDKGFSFFNELPIGEYKIKLGITVPKDFDMKEIKYDSKYLLKNSKGGTNYGDVEKRIIYDGENSYIKIILKHRPNIDYNSEKPTNIDIEKYLRVFEESKFDFKILELSKNNLMQI